MKSPSFSIAGTALRWLHISFGFIFIVLVVFGGQRMVHGQTSTDPIRIGAVLPLTGWGAAGGSYVLSGAKISLDKINAANGVKGRKLELIVEDGKAAPAESVNAAEKLITRDKVSVVFGGWLSTATLAMIPVIERNEVPFVVETSGAYKITHPLNKWVFRFAPLFSQEASGVEKCLLDLKFKNVAFLAHDNDWGRGSVEEFGKVLAKQGGKTILVEYVDATATDFYPQLTKIKNSAADSIIVTNDASAVSKLLQQHKELGMKQKIITTGGSNWTDAIIRMAGAKAAEGSYHILFFAAFAPESAPNPVEAKIYVDEWKKRSLHWDGVEEGSRGYDAVYTIAKAIELADGSSKRADIRKALESVDIMGLTAHIKFDAYHDAKPNILLVQVKQGKSTIVKCK